MVNQGLVVFIQNALNQGRDINSVRSQLLQQGYNPYEVDEAVNFLFSKPREVHHTIRFSKSAIIAIVALVLGISLSVYLVLFLTSGSKQPAKLLDFETSPIKSAVKPGDMLSFQIRLFNMGDSKRYDVTVESQIVSQNGRVLAKKEDTFAVERRTTETMQIEVPPSLSLGTYSLKSTATYSKGMAVSSFEFRVYQESATPTCWDNIQNQGETSVDCGGLCKPCPTCSDGKKNQDEGGIDCGGTCPISDCCTNGYQDDDLGETGVDCGGVCKPCEALCDDCDDKDACTRDSCDDGKCVHEAITPCCGNGACESGETEQSCPEDCERALPDESPREIIEKAAVIVKTDPERATEMCESLREVRDQDRCFEVLSENTNQSIFCDEITSVSKRDACYMSFAMDGDYSVCEKVENTYLKNSCEKLKYIYTVET